MCCLRDFTFNGGFTNVPRQRGSASVSRERPGDWTIYSTFVCATDKRMSLAKARFAFYLIPLCVIPFTARAGGITYTLTQNLPSIDGESPSITWTTGLLADYVADGTPIPFLFGGAANADAIADEYSTNNIPFVLYDSQSGSFLELYADYSTPEALFASINLAACPAGSSAAGCTFGAVIDYEAGLDPPAFAADRLDINNDGGGSVPEPASAALTLLGVLGLLAGKRLRSRKA